MTSRRYKKGFRTGRVVRRLLVALLALPLLLALLPGQPVQAAESGTGTYVEKAELDIDINSDGTVDITETLAYHFHKAKKSISFELLFPIEGEPHLTSLEFALKTAGGEEKFIPVPERDELKSQPLSYTTLRKRDRIRVDMRMTELSGDYLFRLSYQWNRGVVHKEGKALISGPLLAVRPETPVDTMRWTITMPASCRIENSHLIPISGHTMTQNKLSENSIAYVDNQRFLKLDGLGILISSSASCFPLILPASDPAPLATLVDRAEALSKRLARLGALRDSIGRFIMPLIAAGLLIYALLYLLQMSWIRRIRPDYACWAAEGTPALVAKLVRVRPGSSHLLLGTLLHLINRKEIEWVDEIFIWKNPGRDDFSGFTSWEILLLQWLFAQDEDYDHVLAPERLRYAARSADFRELAQRFQKQIEEGYKESPFVRPQWTTVFRLLFLTFAALFLVTALLLFFFTHATTAFYLLIPVAIFSFGGLTFSFLTEIGVRRYLETFAFMRQLKKPQALVASCAGRFNDVETLISILPAAVVLNKRKNFFQGVRSLPQAAFLRAAYALLHVYRRIPIPSLQNLPAPLVGPEIERLNKGLDEMERALAAWKENFDSCFIA